MSRLPRLTVVRVNAQKRPQDEVIAKIFKVRDFAEYGKLLELPGPVFVKNFKKIIDTVGLSATKVATLFFKISKDQYDTILRSLDLNPNYKCHLALIYQACLLQPTLIDDLLDENPDSWGMKLTGAQTKVLEDFYQSNHYPNHNQKNELADKITDIQTKIKRNYGTIEQWFSRRRKADKKAEAAANAMKHSATSPGTSSGGPSSSSSQ